MRAYSSTNDTTKPQTGAETARVEGSYESLDVQGTKQAFDELNGVLDKLANTVVLTLDQIVPELAKMQALLSQRGAERKKVLRGAGLPSWTSYAKAYAEKVERSLRTFQQRIKQYREQQASGTTSPGAKAKRSNNGKRVKLDARQQAVLVKAQLAINDLVAALKGGGDWQTPLAEYEKVAVTPAKLDSYLNALDPEPDLKGVLSRLVKELEPVLETLPASAKETLREAKLILGGRPGKAQASSDKKTTAAKKQTRVEKHGKEGGNRSAARAEEGLSLGVKKLTSSANVTPSPAPSGSTEDRREEQATSCDTQNRIVNFVRNEKGGWDYEPKLEISELEEASTAQPAVQPLPRVEAMKDAAKPYYVKRRTSSTGEFVDFAVIRRRDGYVEQCFETESEANAYCEKLNASAAASIDAGAPAPQKANHQDAVESNANKGQDSRAPGLAVTAEVRTNEESPNTNRKEEPNTHETAKAPKERKAKAEAGVKLGQTPPSRHDSPKADDPSINMKTGEGSPSLRAEAREKVANQAPEIVRKAADRGSYSVLKVLLNGIVHWASFPKLHRSHRYDPAAPQISLLVVGGTKTHKEDKSLRKAALAGDQEKVRAVALGRFDGIRPGFFEDEAPAAEGAGVAPEPDEIQVTAMPPSSRKTTSCRAARNSEAERREAPAGSSQTVTRQGDFVRTSEGKWEYVPEGEAQAVCDTLNASCGGGFVPPGANSQIAGQLVAQ